MRGDIGNRTVMLLSILCSAIDTLFDGKRFYLYKGTRLKGSKEKFHGTGCLLSSAIAAGLAKGINIKLAIKTAKDYVRKTIMER